MTKRDEAIQAAARAFCREIAKCVPVVAAGGVEAIDKFVDREWRTWLQATTAAFDEFLKVIAEPDAEMVEAGARAALKSELSPRRDPELAWENEKDAWLHNIAAAHPAIIRKLMGGGE